MFTGIVKELGKVRRISGLGGLYKLSVEAKNVADGSNIGDSVSINGVCLTLTAKNKNALDFDVMGETFKRTNFSKLTIGEAVNLEPALRVGDPLGGHFVTGHIDCVGRIRDIRRAGDNYSIEIAFPPEYKKLVVEKGSIALDGISLTVGSVGNSSAVVHIIPHTLKLTTLGSKRSGDEVNIEFDIIGKYIL
ncbi:MAG: riboflavin synthase, partial [Candidatus Omnitrophica bacterium]|nr:riboflavin synthase [Candidatus Omnitrophota bacterium]